MRVVSGKSKGKKLENFSDSNTRPTSEKVKESMMNIIQFEIEGARVLDLFAGTGQLGIEALSRNAKSCDFVDNNSKCIQLIKRNLTSTELIGSANVVKSNVEDWIKNSNNKYDIVFLDPPYGQNQIPKLLGEIIKRVNDWGIIVCELEREDQLPEAVDDFSKSKDYKYGKKKINIYRKKEM